MERPQSLSIGLIINSGLAVASKYPKLLVFNQVSLPPKTNTIFYSSTREIIPSISCTFVILYHLNTPLRRCIRYGRSIYTISYTSFTIFTTSVTKSFLIPPTRAQANHLLSTTRCSHFDFSGLDLLGFLQHFPKCRITYHQIDFTQPDWIPSSL